MIPFPLRSSCCMKGKFLGDQGYSYWPLWWYGDQDKLNDFAGNCMLSVSGAYFDGNGYYFDGNDDYLIDAGGRKVLRDGTMGTWSSVILTDGEVPPEGSIQGTGTKLYLNNNGVAPKITGKIILYPAHCPALTHFVCNDNSLTTIKVSAFTTMTFFRCHLNCLDTVDISGSVLLNEIYCQLNDMSPAMVDTVLRDVDAYETSNGMLMIDRNSPPSAAGLVYKSNLVGRNWTVTTD